MRDAIPPITRKEIDRFKEILASYADIYVNDAFEASLSASNSVNELKIKQSVMGI